MSFKARTLSMASREQQILDRLMKQQPEDNFVERKPASVTGHELRQTLVAFSNSLAENDTGVLFVGVHDKTGAILGVDNPEKVQMRIGEAGEECYPAIRPLMIVLDVQEKRIIAVEISYSKEKPHFAGPAYIRSGSRSPKASDSLYRDLLTSHCSKAGELLRWKDKVVTVRMINKKLGNRHPEWDPASNREYECTVVGCDQFSVQFKLHGYDEYCTESLSRIELDRDSIKDRRLVIVRGTPPAGLR
jgi:hypothetical protein